MSETEIEMNAERKQVMAEELTGGDYSWSEIEETFARMTDVEITAKILQMFGEDGEKLASEIVAELNR